MFKLTPSQRRPLPIVFAIALLMFGTPHLASAGAGVACVIGTGSFSTECGVSSSTGTANDATAIGDGAEASGTGTTAVGTDANANATRATAYGRDADATQSTAVAIGAAAQATGLEAVAVGGGANTTYSARAAGTRSIAIGGGSSAFDGASAAGNSAIAIGNSTSANSTGSVAIGLGATATEPNQVVLGDVDRFNLKGAGRLGLGTATVDAPLDILASVDTIGTGNAVFKIANPAGPTAFQLDPSDDGTFWNISATADNNEFRFSRSGTGTVEMRLDSAGNMTLNGALTTAGPSCSGGCDAVFDDDHDLATIAEHAAQMWANRYLPAVGPTTPGTAINVSEMVGLLLNELETAHIYIDQLNTRVNDQDARLAHLEALVAALTE